MRPPSSLRFPCCGLAILLQSFTLCYPSSVCLGFTAPRFPTYFFPCASHVPRLTACVPTPPERGSCRSHTPPGSPFLPPPSHLQRFVTAVRKWQRASTSGLADCRLQEGRELEIGKIASAGFLMCLSYLTCLACWLFSLLYAAICFFLYCASLWVTLYDNSRHVLGYGRKTKGFGNWKGGFFRRGTVGQTRRRECTKNRTWPHTSLLYNVRLSIDTTSFTR